MKSIADRFEAEQGKILATLDGVIRWLKAQPENSKTFSLEEVEAIAREAVACSEVRFDLDDSGDVIFPKNLHFNEDYWANKKKELGV